MNSTKRNYYSFTGIAGIIAGAAILIIGILLLIVTFIIPEPQLVTAGQEIPHSSRNVYDMGQVLVIDQYGFVRNSDDYNEDYYLIAYYTEDETPHLASLKVTEEDENLYNKLNSYASDDNAYIGDLYINVCAKAEPLSNIDPELVGYYKDCINLYSDYFAGVDDSQVSLDFYCEGAEAFPAALEEHNSIMLTVRIITGAVIAIGVISIVISIVKLNKAKALKAQMAQQGFYYPPVNQPGVYYNPQAGANQWNNGVPYQQPQNGNVQWNNGAPYQQPQDGTNQWSNGAPYQQPANADTNQYYTPPTENNSSQINASDDPTQNNQQ